MKDKILIAVPSKNRYRDNEIHRKTLSWLQHTQYDFRVFVEPQDKKNYSSVPNLVILDKNNGGLGYAKSFIHKYAVKNDYDYIFKVDDDVYRWRDIRNRGLGIGKSGGTTKQEYCRIFERIIEDSFEILEDTPNIGAISLPYGNEISEIQKFTEINKRLQSCYLIRTNLFYDERLVNISTMEDFATFFNVLKKGYYTVRYGLTGIDCERVGVNSGGIQDFDRRKQNELEKQILEELHPEIVWKRVQKNWNWEPDLRKTSFTKSEKI